MMMHPQWDFALKKILPATQILNDPAACISYSYDNGRHQAIPAAVVLPQTTEQVQNIVAWCQTEQIPLTARGRGTGTPGGSVPSSNGLVISFEQMNNILSFCPESRYMIVEPGVLNQTVQTLAGQKQLLWGPDPSSQAYCTVGGNLAYNAGGPHTLKYGATKDNVLYVEAVTGAGELIKTGFAVNKSACGYDLTRLLIGSEGTLALFTKICLKLSPKPESSRLLQLWFADEQTACQAIATLTQTAVNLSALEFMDRNCLTLLKTHSDLIIPPTAQALLLVEIDGLPTELTFYSTKIRTLLPDLLSCEESTDPKHAWAARKKLSPILRKLAAYKINEDVVVPVGQLHALLQTVQEITQQENILNVNFGHAGNGNLHVNLLLHDSAQMPAAQRCLEKIFAAVIALGGTLSGEHGIGLEKKTFLTQAYSAPTLDLMYAIKKHFDPHNILNPGKLLP
jgi:D-lactate dehydrogenase (quinone)